MDEPPFLSVGEAVEFFRQIIEGVQFMHHHHIAHRDVMKLNIMMDPNPMSLEPCHPQLYPFTLDAKRKVKFLPRTVKPTRYYLIDFGLSRRYPPHDTSPLEVPIKGGRQDGPRISTSESVSCT
ncbi:hypothetical protein C8Q75DRAFT_259269 [Abortiporus biennis]|nr:hypothetical protein C8Q75DRAFT_259269 [Abortiporus biennis]